MLEEILDQWCREHESELLAGYEKLKADKAAFLRQPVSKTNIEALRQAKTEKESHRRMELIDAARNAAAGRRQTIRDNVASACLFLVKQGRDPRTATPQEILEILGVSDKCTVDEIATAYQSLADGGDIKRIIRKLR
jgi:hypothetical protein